MTLLHTCCPFQASNQRADKLIWFSINAVALNRLDAEGQSAYTSAGGVTRHFFSKKPAEMCPTGLSVAIRLTDPPGPVGFGGASSFNADPRS